MENSTGGTPVQIAYFNNHKLIINTDIFKTILDKVGDHPLSVVSINGPMRSGKSYISSHFLRYLSICTNRDKDWFTKKLDNEFHWVNSSERQTTGISMWSEPFFIEKDGRKVAVLLMDTQGFFDEETTTNENSLIFALSCLLSSVLIYNVPKQLSEDIYQFLQMFIGFAKMAEGSEQSQSLSKLIFLIRDWQFPKDFQYGYHDEATSPGQKNYKKEKINVKGSMNDEVRIVRQEVLSSFKNIGCCLMPYPGDNLALEDDVENLNLRFIETLKDFVPRIFDAANIVTKKIDGEEINGNLIKYINLWANEFAKIDLPEVKNIAESTAIVQNQFAQTIALKLYNEKMNIVMKNEYGLSDEEFEKVHKKNMEEAFALFERMKRLKNEKIKQQYFEGLKESIHKELEHYQKTNQNSRRFHEIKIKAEEREKELMIKIEENALKTRENEEALKQEVNEMAKKSKENEEVLKQQMEDVVKKSQDAQKSLILEMKHKAEAEGKKSKENEALLKKQMEEVIKKSQEAQESLILEMKNKAEAEEKRLKKGLVNKIKRRLSEKKDELTQCISNYSEEIELMINKTNATKTYAEGFIVEDASSLSWWLTKTVLTVGIAPIVGQVDLHSKLNDLIKEIQSFETKQNYRKKEFSARIAEAFSIFDELIEYLEEFGDDGNNSNTLSVGRKVQLVMLDTGSHIRLFKEGSERVRLAETTVSLSKEFVTALGIEKKYCESILEKIN